MITKEKYEQIIKDHCNIVAGLPSGLSVCRECGRASLKPYSSYGCNMCHHTFCCKDCLKQHDCKKVLESGTKEEQKYKYIWPSKLF